MESNVTLAYDISLAPEGIDLEIIMKIYEERKVILFDSSRAREMGMLDKLEFMIPTVFVTGPGPLPEFKVCDLSHMTKEELKELFS